MPTDYIGHLPMPIDLSQEKRDKILQFLSTDLTNLITHLRDLNPDDRSELARRFAVATTEAEKLDGYITQYILHPIGNER